MAVVGGPPGDISALFGLERGRLLDLLNSLEPTDWSRETPCPGWSVLGLVSHLVNGDLGVLSRDRDHFLGTRSPDSADESEFIKWLDELMQEWVEQKRNNIRTQDSFSMPLTERLTCEVTSSDLFSTGCDGPTRTASPTRSDRSETR